MELNELAKRQVTNENKQEQFRQQDYQNLEEKLQPAKKKIEYLEGIVLNR